MSQTDTHYYDGRWSHLYQEKIKTIKTIKDINPESFETTVGEINLRWPMATNVSNLLLTTRQQNYDNKNSVSLEELLPIVWYLIKILPHGEQKQDIENVFIEQYMDIRNGSCAQGRTTRIFQVLQLL